MTERQSAHISQIFQHGYDFGIGGIADIRDGQSIVHAGVKIGIVRNHIHRRTCADAILPADRMRLPIPAEIVNPFFQFIRCADAIHIGQSHISDVNLLIVGFHVEADLFASGQAGQRQVIFRGLHVDVTDHCPDQRIPFVVDIYGNFRTFRLRVSLKMKVERVLRLQLGFFPDSVVGAGPVVGVKAGPSGIFFKFGGGNDHLSQLSCPLFSPGGCVQADRSLFLPLLSPLHILPINRLQALFFSFFRLCVQHAGRRQADHQNNVKDHNPL